MAYATTADLEVAAGGPQQLVQLTDWNGDGIADAGVLLNFLTQAQSEIDGYLAKNFAVPLAAPGEHIAAMAARIAVYRMRCAKRMATEAEHEGYKLDVAALVGYRAGQQVPGLAVSPVKSTMRVDGSYLRPETKEVSRSKLRGFS